MDHTIEVCCTGNNNRSKMAEAIGNELLRMSRLEKKIRIISSGTRVLPPYDAALYADAKKAKFIFERAKQSGLYDVSFDSTRYQNDEGYKGVMYTRAKTLLGMFRSIESSFRQLALIELDLEAESDRHQTIPRRDVSLILGIEQRHVAQIEDIYSDTPPFIRVPPVTSRPRIESLSCYAQVGYELPDLIGTLSIAGYRGVRDCLHKDIMPSVIERFCDEIGIP